MPPLRSRTVTHGRNMAGARALLRATGVAREDLGKPIIAVANSFTEFVPGHVHLRQVGQVVAASGGLAQPVRAVGDHDRLDARGGDPRGVPEVPAAYQRGLLLGGQRRDQFSQRPVLIHGAILSNPPGRAKTPRTTATYTGTLASIATGTP